MNTKITILKILKSCGTSRPILPIIRTETECRHGAELGDFEFAEAIGGLIREDLIASKKDPITHDKRYYITATGLGYLENGNV